MSRKIAPFIDIVRLEDKETKLKAFIRTVVEQATAAPDASGTAGNVLLVARSVDSPVAKAVASLVREGAIAGPVKAVLALLPRDGADASACETMAALVGSHGGRVVRDSRLFDAHEQLVLGPASSWFGDCMRRDPMKRDAYECYAADCSKTAGWARTSFDRLWDTCAPLCADMRAPAAHICDDAGLGPEAQSGSSNDPVGSAG